MKMPSFLLFSVLTCSVPATAYAQSPSNPPPPPPASTGAAMPYLQIAGESDVYEVTSSQIALQRSQNPKVRAFATMLIDHHTKTTNAALTQAKAAGLMPPPAVLGQGSRSKIDQLYAAAPGDFDRVYIAQQIPAHEQALAVQTAYAAQGDKAPLRASAKAAIPIITQHLKHARALQAAR